MKHASSAALDTLEPLLEELRRVDGLRETTRGHFYRRSTAILHFHEDPSGIYADVKLAAGFERRRATDPDEQAALLACVRAAVATGPSRQGPVGPAPGP